MRRTERFIVGAVVSAFVAGGGLGAAGMQALSPDQPPPESIQAPDGLYTYRARCTRIIDGDTFHATIDPGFHLHTFQRIRVAEVDTPELRGAEREAGLTAKAFADDWLECNATSTDWPLLAETIERDPFGRWVTKVSKAGVDFGQTLLDTGHATVYEPRGEQG